VGKTKAWTAIMNVCPYRNKSILKSNSDTINEVLWTGKLNYVMNFIIYIGYLLQSRWIRQE
jgi:hypothetical protein